MLRWIGVIFVIAGCSGMGYSMKRDMQQRLSQLKALQKVLERLGSEVEFYKTELAGACLMAAERAGQEYGECLRCIGCRMEENDGQTFGQIWEAEWKKCLKETLLSAEEKKMILRFAAEAGHSDPSMQGIQIRRLLEEIQEAVKRLEKEIENKGKVYTSLGVVSGLFLAIVLF